MWLFIISIVIAMLPWILGDKLRTSTKTLFFVVIVLISVIIYIIQPNTDDNGTEPPSSVTPSPSESVNDIPDKTQSIENNGDNNTNVAIGGRNNTVNISPVEEKGKVQDFSLSQVSVGTSYVTVKVDDDKINRDYYFGIAGTSGNLNDISDWQYQDNDNHEKTFTDLKANTAYYVYAYCESSEDNHQASIKKLLIITDDIEANKKEQDPVYVSFVSSGTNYVKLKATGGSGVGRYIFAITNSGKVDDIQYWHYEDASGEKMFIDLSSNGTYYVFARRLGDEVYNKSVISDSVEVHTAKTIKNNQQPVHVTFLSSTSNTVQLRASGGSGTGQYIFGIGDSDDPETVPYWYYPSAEIDYKMFTELKPARSYYVFAYRQGDIDYDESKISAAVIVTTKEND